MSCMHRNSADKNNKRTNAALLFNCLSICFLSFISISAATVQEYRENLHKGKYLLIESLYSDDAAATPNEQLSLEREKLAELRRMFTDVKNVEWRGTAVEPDNRWLIESLDALEKANLSSPERDAYLGAIYERLDAIEYEIKELESISGEMSVTKDEDKRRLSDILRREAYQKPESKGETLFQKIMRHVKQWINDLFPSPNLPENSGGGFQSLSFILQIALYALIAGAIGFLGYRFAPLLIKQFKTRKNQERNERVILGERLSAEESSVSLLDQAERLARAGDLRGAIRKGYIAVLCELNDRKIIRLAQHKTNRDYLRDVRSKSEIHRNLSDLTASFERHWYGFDDAGKEDWENFRQNYEKAVKAI